MVSEMEALYPGRCDHVFGNDSTILNDYSSLPIVMISSLGQCPVSFHTQVL